MRSVRFVGLVALVGCVSPDVSPPDSVDDAVATHVFRQTSVRRVADHDTLMGLGLVSWPDSIVGFATHPDGTVYGFGFGTDGDVMRATFSADGDTITEGIRAPVGPTPPDGEWWGSGGPVYYDEPSGLLLMVTHDEDYDVLDSSSPHVSLRMAVSPDWGETWTDLGKIIDHAFLDGPYHYMGNGGFVVIEEGGQDHLVVYHADAHGPDAQHQAAASRAPLAAVIAAAKARQTPVFTKWNGTDWTAPGLGGTSVDLMPDWSPQAWGVVGDLDPYWVPAVEQYVAFYPSQIDGSVWPPTWNVYQTWSPDGLHWSSPAVKVYPEDLVGGDPIYIGLRAHNRVLSDAEPALYRLWVTDDDDRWGSSTFERVDLELVEAE